MERRQISPLLKCGFDQVYAALKAMPNQQVDGLITTGGVKFNASAKIARDNREFIDLPHGNRIYHADWGYTTNGMGEDGQRIGQYSVLLDEWCFSQNQ